MKVAVITLCLLATVSANVLPAQEDPSSRIIEGQIVAALEELRELMKSGSEDFPILDPLQVDQFYFELEDIGAQGTLSVNGAIIENLSEFILNNIDFSLIARRLRIDIGVPKLVVSADNIVMNAAAHGQEIKGTGHGALFLVNSGIRGTMRVRIPLFGDIQVYNVDLSVYLESVKSHLTLHEGEHTDEELNEILEFLIPFFVQTNQKELSDFINPLIEEFVNEFLSS